MDLANLELKELDLQLARMSEYELSFTAEIRRALELGELNKTELLNGAGYAKDDKTARDCLDKFDGKLWFSRKAGKNVIYSCRSSATTDTTITTMANKGLFDEDK